MSYKTNIKKVLVVVTIIIILLIIIISLVNNQNNKIFIKSRHFHNMTMLDNNKVLITGCNWRWRVSHQPFPVKILDKLSNYFENLEIKKRNKVAEIYDTNKNKFIQINSNCVQCVDSIKINNLKFYDISSNAVKLKSNKILITGLYGSELFDPITNKFLKIENMNVPRFGHQAILLNNGKVLIVGGSTKNNEEELITTASSELFDPITNKFLKIYL